MRVNARVNETTQQQLDYLAQTTGATVSHILRESVAQYYDQVRSQRKPSRFLAMAGKGDSGLGDVASNIRAYVTESLERKHGLPPLPNKPAVAAKRRVRAPAK